MSDRREDGNAAPGASPMTRRRFIQGTGAVGAGAAVAGGLSTPSGRLIERALEAASGVRGSLSDVEHIVVLMQENRSFDHYFGTLSGVRGFSDRNVIKQTVNGHTYPIFDQFGWQVGVGPNPNSYMQPFHLLSDPPTYDGQATNDITHEWSPQHESWNNGGMNQFLTAHLAADGNSNGPVTMGYFDRSDLAFYYALADAFTICDHYFCSVLGPTDPNRVMLMSGSIDPAGVAGGPVIETFTTDRLAHYNTLGWTTMPENLIAAGVSWKVYADTLASGFLNPLQYFKAYSNPLDPNYLELAGNAFNQSYPDQFAADVALGTLPQVSWIIPPLAECEHPAAPPEYGEYLVSQVLGTLVSNPAVWEKTVLVVIYDENGGFFDHVPPPTAPAGTADEFLTVNPLPAAAGGVAGPVGLGFRVPCLVVSPFSRGGYLSSAVYDHTSTLQLISARFGVPVPGVSAWRHATVSNLSKALDFVNPPNPAVPTLPATSLVDPSVAEQAVINTLLGTLDDGTVYPPPSANVMPKQETTPVRPRVP